MLFGKFYWKSVYVVNYNIYCGFFWMFVSNTKNILDLSQESIIFLTRGCKFLWWKQQTKHNVLIPIFVSCLLYCYEHATEFLHFLQKYPVTVIRFPYFIIKMLSKNFQQIRVVYIFILLIFLIFFFATTSTYIINYCKHTRC